MARAREVRRAFTPEWRHPEAWLVWTLRALLAALAAYAPFVQPSQTSPALLLATAAVGLLVSVGFAFIPTRRPRTLKAAEATLLLAFLFHGAGHAMGWYDAIRFYDKGLHFLVPFAATLMLGAMSQATYWIWDWREVRPVAIGVYVFSMALALGALWEVLEFSMDSLFGTNEQNGLVDTMVDLIADSLGAFVGSITVALIARYGRRHGHHKISEPPKRPAPSRAPTEGSTE